MSAPGRHTTPSLLIIFLTAFVDMVGFGIIIPVLPYFAEHYGADGLMVGVLTAVFLVMQFLSAPVWGVLSDRWGRRPVILVCIFASAGSYILFGLAKSLLWIFVARMIGGLFAGKFSTIQAYIADVTTRENRSRGMGLFGAAFGLGFIVGPAIGGLLGRYGYDAPLFFAAALAGLNGAVALFMLPESLNEETRGQTACQVWTRLGFRATREVLGRPVVMASLLVGAVFNFAFSMLYSTFALFTEREFGFHTEETGYVFAYIGVIGAVIQGGLIGRLSRRVGEMNMIKGGLAMTAAGMFFLGCTDHLTLLAAAVTLMAAGSGLLTPALSGLVSLNTAEEQQGQVLGLMQSVANLARMTGMIFGGYLFETISIWSPFWTSSLILCCGTVYAVLQLRSDHRLERLNYAGDSHG